MTAINAPSATDTSWLYKDSSQGVTNAVNQVKECINKVHEYTSEMIEPDKKSEIETKAGELNISDPINITADAFHTTVNDNYKGDDLEEETTSKLRTIILLQMATDSDTDGKLDANYDTNGDGIIDDTTKVESIVNAFLANGLNETQTTRFNQLLAATLLEFPEKDNLVDYVNGILGDDTTTETTSTTDTTTQTPVPAPATTV